MKPLFSYQSLRRPARGTVAAMLACIAGTLPATVLFEQALGAKTLFFSFSTADEKLHAPNEFMRIRRVREGMRAWEQLWRLLASGPHRLESRGSSLE